MPPVPPREYFVAKTGPQHEWERVQQRAGVVQPETHPCQVILTRAVRVAWGTGGRAGSLSENQR